MGLRTVVESRSFVAFDHLQVGVLVDKLRGLAISGERAYYDRPELLLALEAIGKAGAGAGTGQLMHRLMHQLASEFNADDLPYVVTSEVREMFLRSLKRICSRKAEDYQADDRFLKDLALCCGGLFPAGERVVEPASVLQRALLHSAGLSQSLRFLFSVACAAGTKPMFRLHVHLDEAPRLSEDTWRQTCRCLAGMLSCNPAVKGVVGGSWFYDPQLPKVSPRLGFIKAVLEEAGATWFYARDEGPESGALLKSESRRRLFNEHGYTPKAYVIFWPRKAALRWLARQEPPGPQDPER